MNYIPKLGAFFTLFLFISLIKAEGKTASFRFNKSAYYAAMASIDINAVNAVLADLKETSIPEMSAYEGALLMKKAGLVSKLKDKLSLFKSGRSKLEAAIKNDQGNIEYHFLRLIIQENSPKIVRYKTDLKNDTELVCTGYKNLSPVVQQAVRDYSKKSAFLQPANF